MPSLHLTKSAVEALPFAEKGQKIFRDEQLLGFGLVVGAKSKTYIVEARVGGKNVRCTVGRATLLSAEVARQKAKGLLGEMAEGRNPMARKRALTTAELTLAEAFVSFFTARKLAAVTVDAYQRTVDLYLEDWKAKPLAKVSRGMVLARHQKLNAERGGVTANNVMRHLRSVYNFAAASHEELPPNPVGIIRQARAWAKERRRQSVVKPHQLPAWWQAVMAETEDARDILLVALFTGMRRSEVVTMRWAYLDLQAGLLRLPRTKNGDPLELPLSGFLADLLKARHGRAGASGWVFPGTGHTGHLTEVKSFVGRVKAASGVEFTMHDLRRTFITVAEGLDLSAYALKRLVNHRVGGDVTAGYIVHDVERLREPVGRIAQRLLLLAQGGKPALRVVA
jgi:integrase